MSAGLLRAVRHGSVGHEGICYGHLDLAPLEAPELSARRLLPPPPGPRVLQVFTSPLSRCRDLAAALAQDLEARLVVDVRLRELHFGAFEGRSWEELEQREPEALRRWMEAWKEAAPPGGEPLPALEARVGAWLGERSEEELAASLLVGHAGVLRALRVLRSGGALGWDAAMESPVPHLTWMLL